VTWISGEIEFLLILLTFEIIHFKDVEPMLARWTESCY
jgi:hypothetical protein